MERRTGLVGVYGGTFDPIHLGHVHLAKSLLKQFEFDHFYIIPAKQNPLKQAGPHISEEDRLALITASLSELGDPRVKIDDRELKRKGLSYTVDTLRELRATLNKGQSLVLIMGDEVFKDLAAWKNPQEILSQNSVIIVKRPGLQQTPPMPPDALFKSLGLKAGKWESNQYVHPNGGNLPLWIETVEINAPDYSSTEMREMMFSGWNSGVLPEMPQGIQRSVWLLIKEKQLYRR